MTITASWLSMYDGCCVTQELSCWWPVQLYHARVHPLHAGKSGVSPSKAILRLGLKLSDISSAAVWVRHLAEQYC